MTSVVSAVKGAAVGSSSDASSKRPNTTEARVIERIIITVPPTVGVTMRRKMNSHREITSWTIAAARINVVNVAGPPSTSAVMQNGMENAAVKNGRTVAAPIGPSRRTCTKVAAPTTSSEAKTIHTR